MEKVTGKYKLITRRTDDYLWDAFEDGKKVASVVWSKQGDRSWRILQEAPKYRPIGGGEPKLYTLDDLSIALNRFPLKYPDGFKTENTLDAFTIKTYASIPGYYEPQYLATLHRYSLDYPFFGDEEKRIQVIWAGGHEDIEGVAVLDRLIELTKAIR